MRLNSCRSIALAVALLLVSPVAFAEHHEAETAPGSFRAGILKDVNNMEKKIMGLAEAIPAGSYGWGPAPEVRSTAASFVHMAQANHQILQALGVEAPEGLADMEANVTEKADVQAALTASFAAVTEAVKGLSDDDLDTMVPFFGSEWSKRHILMLVSGHCHEHLGQAIVYARSMGVVPPWSQPRDDSGDGGGDDEG